MLRVSNQREQRVRPLEKLLDPYRRLTVWRRNRSEVARAHLAARVQGITLARVIGNDLFPRHAMGQSLRNLDFILDAEPDFPGWNKLFVLNRLFDAQAATKAEERIRARGHDVIVLSFDASDYASMPFDLSSLGGLDYFESGEFRELPDAAQLRRRVWACAPKIRYAMNINGARNAALEAGRAAGDWTLVLDGGCFVSAASASALEADFSTYPFAPYLIVPMVRVQRNDAVLGNIPDWKSKEEPQIAFHRSAAETFDERFIYGIRDKTALFERLGVPGPWQKWKKFPWLPEKKERSPDKGYFKYGNAGVFRLTSDPKGGALEAADAKARRNLSRNEAILRTIAHLDSRYSNEDHDLTRQIIGVEQALMNSRGGAE